MCWHVCTQALSKTAGADDDCSLGGHLTDKSDDRVGHLNTIFLGVGMLKFRVYRCIIFHMARFPLFF